MMPRGARVISSGLIGTSIALKLKELGVNVQVEDLKAEHQELASDLINGTGQIGDVDLVVIATPVEQVFDLLKSQFDIYPSATFIDVASVKTNLQLQVDALSGLSERFVSTHPIAGRETGGAESAQADLFEGRAWIICSGSQERRRIVAEIIEQLGATVYEMSVEEHDQLFAYISHLPQLLSTALSLTTSKMGGEVALAGQGLRDMLRLASSSGELWSSILLENRGEISAALEVFKEELAKLEEALLDNNQKLIISQFDKARENRERVGGKHGAKPRAYSYVNIVIEDRPGQLSAIFRECEEIAVNIEDLSIEHSPKQETGLVRLALSSSDAQKLADHLKKRNWKAHLA